MSSTTAAAPAIASFPDTFRLYDRSVKAIVIHEDGGPEVLRYEDIPDPFAGPGEVLVRMRFASLNHLDVWTRKGLPSAPKPHILGADGSGVLEALGDGVSDLEPGQPVVINPGLEHDGVIHVIGEHTQGGARGAGSDSGDERGSAEVRRLVRGGGGLSAGLRDRVPTLVTRALLQGGEWVLIWGIGGGVATAAFRIAQALGARTIVTSSSDAKLARAAELGADLTVNQRVATWSAAVKEATGGGADVVVETVGEATWKRTLDAAGAGGRVVVCGATSGRTRRRRGIGSGGSSSTCSARRWARGPIRRRVRPGRGGRDTGDRLVLPLAEARAAHQRLESGEQFGKILLSIPA